jgi:amino acid transporter
VGITFEWWWFMVFLILFVAWTAWRSVELSVKPLIVLGIFEAMIVFPLAISGFASPGTGGANLKWISNSFYGGHLHGLFPGVVFAIFAITAWDAPGCPESKCRQACPGRSAGSPCPTDRLRGGTDAVRRGRHCLAVSS